MQFYRQASRTYGMLNQDAKLKKRDLNMTSLGQTSTPGSFVHFTIRWQKREAGEKAKQNRVRSETSEFVYVGRVSTLAEVLISDAAASAAVTATDQFLD